MNSTLQHFVSLLKKREFYEAHEVLESLWFPLRFSNDEKTKCIRSLINASVSFELAKKNRLDASKRVWQNYTKRRDLIKNYADLEEVALFVDELSEQLWAEFSPK